MKFSKTITLNLCFFVISFAVSGCIPSVSQQENTPNPTSTHASTTPIFTQSLISTMSPDQANVEITDLYITNGGCKFPCFWGIEPGRTTIQQVASQFSLLGGVLQDDTREKDKSNNLTVTLITLSVPQDIDEFNREEWTFRVVMKNDIVEGITTSSSYTNKTVTQTISNMFSIFGKPDEIWVAVMPYVSDIDVKTNYNIALFYPSKGILISGSGKAEILSKTDSNIKFSLCPQDISSTIDLEDNFPFSMHFWSPETKMSFIELKDIHLFGHEGFSLLDSLDSNMDSDAFYETYINPSATQCLELKYFLED